MFHIQEGVAQKGFFVHDTELVEGDGEVGEVGKDGDAHVFEVDFGVDFLVDVGFDGILDLAAEQDREEDEEEQEGYHGDACPLEEFAQDCIHRYELVGLLDNERIRFIPKEMQLNEFGVLSKDFF